MCVCVSVLSPGQARRYFESAKYISQTVWPSVKKRFKSKQDKHWFKLNMWHVIFESAPAFAMTTTCAYLVSKQLLCLYISLNLQQDKLHQFLPH